MAVEVERHGAIAVVTIDNPPVNAASHAVRAGLVAAAEALDADESVRAVLLRCAGRTFVAGADVKEFGRPPQAPSLPEVVDRLEAARVPWCALIHGTALGGGLELALGCRWRLAVESAKLGTPEVELGIVPGAGATVRLPRLVPLALAARMIAGGKPISAGEAHEAGLVDAIVPGDDPLEGALDFLRGAAANPPAAAIARSAPAPDRAVLDSARAELPKALRGRAAPQAALDLLAEALPLPAADAFARERETFLALRESRESQALRHLFLAERAAAKPPVAAEPGPLESAGVVGGGLMGAGIAAAFLDAGVPVTIVERDPQALERARANLAGIYESAVAKGRLTAEARDAVLARATFTSDMAALGEADVIVEAVFEDLAVKRAVFEALDAVAKPGALLATNTSYLDPGEIAAATARPQDVVGLHFFSPANVMKLLEVVRPARASDRALATAWAVAKRLRKVPVLVGVCEGFVGNRILKVYRRAAEDLLLDGASPGAVDAALRAFGLPMGPFEMQDFAGHQISAAVRDAARARGTPVFAPISDRLVTEGRLGRKAGAGWYDYADGRAAPSETVARIIAEEAARAGRSPVALDDAAIQRCVLYPMVNEAATILAEGVAQRAVDIDLVEVLGYGFPRAKGGLLFWAAGEGPTAIRDGLLADGRVVPGDALLRAAEAGDFEVLERAGH